MNLKHRASRQQRRVPESMSWLSISRRMSLYPGAPYEYARAANGLIVTAGACPLDAEGRVVAAGDYEAQAARATENLLLVLAEHGVDAESLLKTTIYVVTRDRDDLVRVWDIVSARLGRAPCTLLGVALLGYPDQLVEIEAIAQANR
jgi:enamine deaminase RidA (YjgF/YER057c/UK114 family)